MGYLFLVVCLTSAVVAVWPFQETDMTLEELADIFEATTLDHPLVRMRREASNSSVNETASTLPPPIGDIEDAPVKHFRMTKQQRLAIILKNLQKNLDDLKSLVKKDKKPMRKGKERRKGKGRKHKRHHSRSRKSKEEKKEEDEDKEKTEEMD